MTETKTALIVAIPEAEPVVGELRLELDSAAAPGVPAHVTVLYPFVPASELTGEVIARAGRIFAQIPAFEITFSRIGWFAEQVVYLAPEPDAAFRTLTEAVWAVFPDCPPYGGAYDDVVPHLTVGDGAPPERLREAADQVAPALPLRALARAVTVLVQQPSGRWETSLTLGLGDSS